MPQPLPGMVPVAEYGSRFDADLAAARLTEYGIESAVVGDPAALVAPHHVTDPGFTVVVLAETVDDAREVLGFQPSDQRLTPSDELDDAYHHRRFADRPRWVRIMTWMLLLAVPIPMALAAFGLLVVTVARLFP